MASSFLGNLGITHKEDEIPDTGRSSESGEQELNHDDVGSEEEISEDISEYDSDLEGSDEEIVEEKQNPYILPHIDVGIVQQDDEHRNWHYDKDVYENMLLPKKFMKGWDPKMMKPPVKKKPPTDEEKRIALLAS